jgi:tyrosine phenol-lyase
MDVVAEAVKAVYKARDATRGLKMIYEPRHLRFLQARFDRLLESELSALFTGSLGTG